jgi:hypothetical protein
MVFHDIGSSPLIPCGNAKMMIAKTGIFPQVWLSPGKGKNAGLPIMRDFIPN